MKKLLAGPDTALEFGWNLTTWIPAIRKRSRNYGKTVIVCRTGNDYLYEDFADKIHHYDKKGDSDRWLLNGKVTHMPDKIKRKYPDAKVIEPRRNVCMMWPREYVMYGTAPSPTNRYGYKVVFHARHMKKYRQSKLNFPPARYEKVMKLLGVDPKHCASIGTKSGAYHVKGTVDLRDRSLQELCNTLIIAKVCVGTSSGPMHLASLCGCPHVVITGNEYLKIIKGTNRNRYKRLWNPFNTPCKVLDKHKWNPPVEKVVKAIRRIIE